MGNNKYKKWQLFIKVILQLLNKRGIKVKKASVQSFFAFIQEQRPWFPDKSEVKSLSHVRLFATPRTVARQAPFIHGIF